MSVHTQDSAERESLTQAAAHVRWWPAAVALLVVSAGYALVSERLTVGPSWILLPVALIGVLAPTLLRRSGQVRAGRLAAMAGLVAITAAISISVVYLLGALLTRSADATTLLQGGVVLWVSNIVTFGLWYWEVDGGGPTHRHASKTGSTDFAFPQMILGPDQKPVDWLPEFLDYLFLAFNTSTAFSPTDTMVLARRAKVMMMYQSMVSLVTVVVLVARAINAL